MVDTTLTRQQSNAMQTANRSVLDLYLQANCLGTIQTHELIFLTDTKDFINPSDIKLIKHIKSKIASGKIRVKETSQRKPISSNTKFRQKTKN